MRVRPFITLIAVGTVTAVLSTACSEEPNPIPPRRFTAIDGRVLFVDTVPVINATDSVWLDSIPVTSGYIHAVQELRHRNPLDSEYVVIDSAAIGPNGEYHVEFTVYCHDDSRYSIRPGPNLRRADIPQQFRTLEGVCTVQNIRYDIWVLPTQ